VDEGDRIYSAWALGNFQSKLAIDALFNRINNETSEPVIRQIFMALGPYFELSGFHVPVNNSELNVSSVKIYLKIWDTAYNNIGYIGLILEGWRKAQLKGEEGIDLFIISLTARYDPQLIPVMLKIASQQKDSDFKDVIENTVFCWSGFNPKKQGIDAIVKEVNHENSLNSKNTLARYIAYFSDAGYQCNETSFKEAALAVLLYENDKKLQFRREMALRMLSCH